MRRLALSPKHRRLAIQLALLGGIGLAFMAQDEAVVAGGGNECFEENECTFKKPNFMIVLDYSSSMSEEFAGGETRWEVAVDAISQLMTTNQGFFQENMHVALMRYGHDPDPDSDGTVIARLDNIEKVDRSAFAMKPSNGFLIILKEPGPRVWRPGLWWRLGRRVAVGGVTNGAHTRPMADMMKLKLAGDQEL